MGNMELFFDEINKVYDCDLTKIRVGNQHDGGYIALKEICEKTNTVYSFGIGDDVGFEMDFIKRFPNSIIRCFDPTMDCLPVNFEKLNFEKSGPEALIDISRNSLLKMDIEGCEWDAIHSTEMFNIKNLIKFDQILIEIHLLHIEPKKAISLYFDNLYKKFADSINESLFNHYYNVIKTLNTFFYIFHIHPNNSLSKVSLQGYRFPPLIELSFVRKGLIDTIYETHTNFPVDGLDFPNKTDRMDIFNFYPIGDKINE